MRRRRKRRRRRRRRWCSADVLGWDRMKAATQPNKVMDLLCFEVICAAPPFRLHSWSVWRRAPHPCPRPGAYLTGKRIRINVSVLSDYAVFAGAKIIRFEIRPTVKKKYKTGDGRTLHSTPTIGGFIQPPTLFWIKSSTIMQPSWIKTQERLLGAHWTAVSWTRQSHNHLTRPHAAY